MIQPIDEENTGLHANALGAALLSDGFETRDWSDLLMARRIHQRLFHLEFLLGELSRLQNHLQKPTQIRSDQRTLIKEFDMI